MMSNLSHISKPWIFKLIYCGKTHIKFTILNNFLNFYRYSITVVCLFTPSLQPTPTKSTSLPHFHHPLWLCPWVLYSSSCKPHFPLSPPHSPPGYCYIVLNFNGSGCILFAFFFYWLFPVKGEIIWYLSLTVCLISLSIMLSRSIHAVAKGISSFFLSAA